LLGLLLGTLVAGAAGAEPDVMARRPAAELLAACETLPNAGPEVTSPPMGLRPFPPGGHPSWGGPARDEATRCLAFVEGFLWGHGWAAWRASRDMYFCLPGAEEGTVSARDVIPAVVAYLKEHPQRLDQPAHLMLFTALSSTFPCSDAAPDPSPNR